MSWDYKIEESALRELKALGPSVATEIFGYLDKRVRGSADPRQFGISLGGPLKGLWRYFRILCRLDDRIFTVVVISIGHRPKVYDG